MCILVLAHSKICVDCATHNEVNKFRFDARRFLVTLLEKVFDKNSISFNIVQYASVLDLEVLESQPVDVCKSFFQRLLFTLVHLKITCSSQADIALSEFSSFYHTSLTERKTSFESFQKELDRLDGFYVKETNICNYELSSVFKLVLVLNHGQEAVERGFSVNNKVLNFNMREISVSSLKWVVDQINSHNLLPESFAITKSLMKSVRCSGQRYQVFLIEK